MTFDELVAAVYVVTNRPDLVSDTEQAVRNATLKAHTTDGNGEAQFYAKDIYETGYSFPTADYFQSLDYINLITNWRAISYLKRVEDAADTEGKFFSVISVSEILDEYGTARTDIAYVAGRVIEIRSSVEFTLGLLGAYVFPIVTPKASFSSWVADQYPYAIVHEAARMIFMSIGQKEEAASEKSLMLEEFFTLKNSSVLDVGY